MTRQNHSCVPLNVALESDGGMFNLTPEMLTLIATRLEDVLADSRDAPLEALHAQLGAGLRAALAQAPNEVIEAIRGGSPTDAHRNAYLLGQVGMAHTVATRAGERRTGEAFAETLTSDVYSEYVAALLDGPLTNSELAARTGERLETVSRKLKKLRDVGATDFRRDGQLVHNFLTAPAQVIAKANAKQAGPLPRPRRVLDEILNLKIGEIESYMVEHQNFSTEGAYSEVSN